jgi:hypothetical protein
MKRIRILFSVLLALGVFSPLCLQASQQDVTLLVVPREEVPVRLGMDIGNHFPTLLLSYRMLPGGNVSLHGWDGAEWINITPEAFATGAFAPTPPATAVIVEKPGVQVPDMLIPDPEWCAATYRITTAETRPLLHLLGRHYGFKFRDWEWFSEEYKMPFDSINPDGLNVAWYHRRLGENLKKKPGGTSDLQYLSIVYIASQLTEEKELPGEEENPADNLDELTVMEDVGEAVADNPLTNAAPQAVIFDADNLDAPAAETEINDQPEE